MNDKSQSITLDEAALTSLGERTLDQLITAIEANETNRAVQLAQRMSEEFQGMHDLYLNWAAAFMSFIGRRYGDDILGESIKEVMQYTADASGIDTAALLEGMSDEERIQVFAKGIRGHMQPFRVKEEKDSYDILLDHCGSGGRLIQQGAYEGPHALHKIKEPSPMTFGQKDFPVYCTHCHFEGTTMGDEPFYEVIASEKPGHSPCVLRMHKRQMRK